MPRQPTHHPRGRTYQLARDGEIPAEALPTPLRWRLVSELHADGWTDTDIAAWTRMTTYTTARIRDGMGLAPNRPRTGGSDAP